MIETLINVSPKSISFKESQLIDFHFKEGSLEIMIGFNGKHSNIRIFFEWTHSFRVTDEGDLLKMLGEQGEHMLVGIYKVENSSYLEWFNEQSCNIHVKDKIIHYVVVAVNDVIDVLASEIPAITVC